MVLDPSSIPSAQMLIIMSYYSEIFLYGGQVGDGIYDGSSTSQKINAGLDEVYILSLPGFVWFKANYTLSDPRMLHTCNIVGNRQMLSIGGLNPSATSLGAAHNETDTFWEGMKIFDLTALQWTNYFNATAAPYTAPGPVAAHYTAGSRYPSTWSSSELKSLFVESTSNSSTPTQPSASALLTQSSASALPHYGTVNTTNHRAVVIGGAVGGVAAVAIVGLALYVFARKRANRKNRKREVSELPPTYKEGEPSYVDGSSEAGQTLSYEVDSQQAPPYEVSSGKTFLHEADSGRLFELSSGTRVGHNDVHEM